MAQQAGAVDVWARYGAHELGDDLEFLKSISYWREEDMSVAEGAVAMDDQPTPRFTIDHFSQLLQILVTLRSQCSSTDTTQTLNRTGVAGGSIC
jgi:hypothetical protein